MRRIGEVWERIVSFENLTEACRKAARGKRSARTVARFLERREPELLRLQRELVAGTWRPGRPVTFVIHDPKTRTISAAPFRDRVIHHALIDPLEEAFDGRLVFESFACRRGKGQHAALRHAQRLVRGHERFLKMDIRACFDSLRHDVVMETLTRLLKDRRALALCERIVEASGEDGRGLPIGNLTSQWFANLVLGRLDRFVKATLRVRGYVRYMDDFVLFADDAARLRQAHVEVMRFLREELDLVLKDRATIHAPVREGLPFLGWRIYRGTRRLRPVNLRRTRRRLHARVAQHRRGLIDGDQLRDAVRSVFVHLAAGSTLALRRKLADSMNGEEPQALATASTAAAASTTPP